MEPKTIKYHGFTSREQKLRGFVERYRRQTVIIVGQVATYPGLRLKYVQRDRV